MSKVAIIITTYNRAELLKNTLESLKESLKNDKNDITGFVVDDGSADNTFDILTEYDHTIIPHMFNEGLRKSLNNALESVYEYPLGPFDYICYVQDDVEFREGWLQECINYWNKPPTSYKETIGFITGHDAPEHKWEIMNYPKENGVADPNKATKLKKTCRATHLFASTKRWKEFGEIPELTPGIAAPKPGVGSLVDWWLVGHPERKYPESKNSIQNKGEYILCIPGMIKHIGVEQSTWGNILNRESE